MTRVNHSDFEALRLSAAVIKALAAGRVPHAEVVRAAERALLQCKTLRDAEITGWSDVDQESVWLEDALATAVF